jgi:methyl-accepting chemotaxis protein
LLLDSSIQDVLVSLEAITLEGANLDELARQQQATSERVAQDHALLDREAAHLREQSRAVAAALDDLDGESSENVKRMNGELGLLRQLSGAVEAVNGIVATLTSTADSTGLLAMNASIEAAHAGAQGRGFAVIAQRMRLQAETSRGDAERIAATLHRMVELIEGASTAAQQTAQGAEATHGKMEAAKALVGTLTRSGENLEAFSGRNRGAAESLTQSSGSMARATGAVASGTLAITASTRSLQGVSAAVLGGAQTILGGANQLTAVAEELGAVANRLTTVSRSLEENLRRIRAD